MDFELRNLVGIPARVINNKTDFLAYTDDVQYNGKMSTWRKQFSKFKENLENPTADSNLIYLLSCPHNNMIPQLAANAIAEKAIEMGNMPFWYNVMKNQKLEDKRLYDVIHERQTQIDLLIIDGIYSQTNINNIDKLRSLMATFDDLPIYVIISGGFGPEVFDTKVFYSYNKFIHFRDIPRKIISEI